jgi:sacsin
MKYLSTFGFPNTCVIPDEILQSAADDEFGFLPRGGTAMQVPTITNSNEIEDKERQIDGNAFCFLPLPISTGLPCHINGHLNFLNDPLSSLYIVLRER